MRIIEGDSTEVLPTLESASVDAVICDPPYPEIQRPYGIWTEVEWFGMMRVVVPECMRILKPTGSAVFILQPNSERAGRMRTWLLEFQLWAAKEWGIVQDVCWWNISALPDNNAMRGNLLRSSVKSCVWIGPPDCHRSQDEVLDRSVKKWMDRNWDKSQPDRIVVGPSGNSMNYRKMLQSVKARGGTTPFNLIPMGNGRRGQTAGSYGHGAGTPPALMRWWTRYICPPGGTVLDPFLGSGTALLAAYAEGRECIGIERVPEYVAIARKRLHAAQSDCPLFPE